MLINASLYDILTCNVNLGHCAKEKVLLIMIIIIIIRLRERKKKMIDINSIQKSKLQIPTFSIQPYINIIFLFSVTLFFFQLYRFPSLIKYPPLTSHLFLYYIHIKYKDKFNCIFMLKVTYCDDGI